jgi:hypothetical protein
MTRRSLPSPSTKAARGHAMKMERVMDRALL